MTARPYQTLSLATINKKSPKELEEILLENTALMMRHLASFEEEVKEAMEAIGQLVRNIDEKTKLVAEEEAKQQEFAAKVAAGDIAEEPKPKAEFAVMLSSGDFDAVKKALETKESFDMEFLHDGYVTTFRKVGDDYVAYDHKHPEGRKVFIPEAEGGKWKLENITSWRGLLQFLYSGGDMRASNHFTYTLWKMIESRGERLEGSVFSEGINVRASFLLAATVAIVCRKRGIRVFLDPETKELSERFGFGFMQKPSKQLIKKTLPLLAAMLTCVPDLNPQVYG